MSRVSGLLGYAILAVIGALGGLFLGMGFEQHVLEGMGFRNVVADQNLAHMILRAGAIWAAICALLLPALAYGLKLILRK